MYTWLTKPSVRFQTLLRKFVSLLVSIWYFENEFTAVHWLGTALVFGGTLVFSEVHHKKTAKRPQSIQTNDGGEGPATAAHSRSGKDS